MTSVAQRLPGKLSRDAYLSFLQRRPEQEHWQLLDGLAIEMLRPSLVHQQIAMNVLLALGRALDGRADLAIVPRICVTIPNRSAFMSEVDVAIIDSPVPEGFYAETLYLAAEVLDTSSEDEFIPLKLKRYAEHPSNLYSLVIARHEICAVLQSRKSGWNSIVLRSGNDVVELPEFGFRCAVRDLYRGTPLA
jgi:Uma2 family endonuclease